MDKATRSTMMSSATGHWQTPQDFYDKLNKEFKFTIDAGSTKTTSLAPYYLEDVFTDDWKGRVFTNPPYGRGIGAWIDRIIEQRDNCEVIVALLPSRTDTDWWQRAAAKAVEVRFVKGRLNFGLKGKQSDPAPFPSCVMVFKPTALYAPDAGNTSIKETLLWQWK